MRRLLGPPLVALLMARAVSAGAALWAGVDPLRAASFIRFDSNLYLEIARRGYTLFHCPPASGYAAAQWCGNAGWFPLYAWLWPSPLFSLACEAAVLVVLWRFFLRERGAAALLLAAVFPGAIYQQAVFPVSLFLLCALSFLALLRAGRTRLAALFGALAALSYPTGILLAPVALLRRRPLAAAGVLLGLFAVLVTLRLQSGSWEAYLLVQHKYGFHFAPVDTLGARLKPLFNARARTAASFASAAQTLLVLCMMALGARSWLRAPDLALYCLLFWGFPLCLGGRLSLHRAEALLVPLVALLPPRACAWLLPPAAIVCCAVSVAFFRGALV